VGRKPLWVTGGPLPKVRSGVPACSASADVGRDLSTQTSSNVWTSKGPYARRVAPWLPVGEVIERTMPNAMTMSRMRMRASAAGRTFKEGVPVDADERLAFRD
jgi:hypothetical protein